MSNADRNVQIYKEFHEDRKTVEELAEAWGLSKPRIYQILTDIGKKAVKVEEGPEEGKVLTQAHVQVGLKFYSHRHFKVEDLEDAAKSLRWSSKKIRQVERGETQLTLSDLIQLAQYMNITLSELFRDSPHTGSSA